MGELAQANETTQARRESPRIEDLIRAAMPKLEAVMPSTLTPERLYQLGVATVKGNSALAACDPASILSCLMKCSALGLEPSEVDGLGRCYIIPRKGQATFMLGYRGMLELMRRSGEISQLSVRAVHQGDDFDYEFGTDEFIRHRPSQGTPGPLTHVYLVARMRDGSTYQNVMTRAEVDARRGRSQARSSGPWSTDYEAMAKKTIVRASAPWLPMSVEVRQALDADGTTPEYQVPDAEGEVA